MLPRRWSLGAAVALMVLGVSSSASADALGDARAAYQRGAAHYERGEFTEAVQDFEIAYRLSKRPGFLYNLARAETQLGHDERALSYLRRYLEEDPGSSDAPSVRAEIAARQRALEEGAAKRRAEADAAAARRQAAEAEARVRSFTAGKGPSSDAPRSRWPGWVLLGGGVALVGGGVAAGVLAQRAAEQVSAGGGSGVSKLDKAIESRGQASEIAGFVCDGLGGALVVAGVGVLVWSYLGPAARPGAAARGRTWISPLPGGVLVGGTF